MQATPFIPNQKQVNTKAVALSLETCIYTFARGATSLSWTDTYWAKIDDIVSAISGAKGPGSVAVMISEGKFQSPDEVVGLSDDSLLDSFHGMPIQC